MSWCNLPPERVKLPLNTNKETNGRVKIAQKSKWAKSQNGLVSFTPERVKLTVNTKKKQKAGSQWAKSQNGPRAEMGFCYLSPERVKMGCYCLHPERVKMGQGSRWVSVIYPLKERKWEKFRMG